MLTFGELPSRPTKTRFGSFVVTFCVPTHTWDSGVLCGQVFGYAPRSWDPRRPYHPWTPWTGSPGSRIFKFLLSPGRPRPCGWGSRVAYHPHVSPETSGPDPLPVHTRPVGHGRV